MYRIFFPCFLLILSTAVSAQTNTGNDHYDFSESILTKNGQRFGYQDRNMIDLAIAGYYHESRAYEYSYGNKTAPIYLAWQHKKILDAREFILREASKYRILLINEAHNRPEHRLFTKSLLQELHGVGYRVFMAEGIRLKNGLQGRSYPVNTDGNLLNEPAYGSLIRYAKKTGYAVYAYEHDAEKKGNKYWDDSIKLDQYGSIKYISYQPRDSAILLFDEKGLKTTIFTSVREKAQAENIVKVMAAHPDSKFVIHVGYGHLYEDGPMMGAKLRDMLKGEDVLTIDQVMLNGKNPVIDTATGTMIIRDFSYILQDSVTSRYFNINIPVDYQLIHKQQDLDSLGRPLYLLEDVEKRTAYNIPGTMRRNCPCVFSAYYQDEYKKEGQHTIAVDIVHVTHQPVPLLLYKGTYIVIKKNKDGQFSDFRVTVR